MSRRTGIDDVRPFAVLENDLSVAMTDFRDWRVTQVRRWPLAAALSRSWGEDDKVLYLNYPRFFRLGMPEPARLETFERIQRFSPEIEARDSADILDRVRMLQDSWSIANLRRAVAITEDGVRVALGAARAGMSETEIMEIMDFVYRYHGAYLGIPDLGPPRRRGDDRRRSCNSGRLDRVRAAIGRRAIPGRRHGLDRYRRRIQSLFRGHPTQRAASTAN